MKIFDRKNNNFIEEKEYGKKKLEFLYNTIIGRILLKCIFASRWFSNVQAIYQKSRMSKKKIPSFIKEYNIDMSEYPSIDTYNSFSDFFKRKRNIKNSSLDNELVATADSKLSVYYLDDKSVLNIKHSQYDLKELLQDEKLADEYNDGICVIYRLSMDNYHRYMYLDDGILVSNKKIKGKLHTIRPISNKYNVYCTNSREISILNTKNFGQVVQVEVGAMLVGKIQNNKNIVFSKLQEKGYFDFGGSTIIQLFKKNAIVLDEDIIKMSKDNIETKVEIGMKIGGRYND